MKILITGGAGYVASYLAPRLIARGHDVVALDNLRRGRREALGAGVRFIEGDVRDEQLLDGGTQGVELIYHLAAESAVMSAAADPEYCFETNVTGTFRILRAAQANGVKRLVFSSSREVYGESAALPVAETAALLPRNIYGASKAAGEMCCGAFLNAGLEVSIVRLANVYGPGDQGRVIPKFVHNALRDLPLTLFGATQVMDFVWIDAVVDALVQLGLGTYLPDPLNIASGKGTTIVELARRVVEAAGTSSKVEVAARRDVEVMKFVADTRAAEAALGMKIPDDPLFGLPAVIEAARAELTRCEMKV
jgi:UDP-glucose 4-epimerase